MPRGRRTPHTAEALQRAVRPVHIERLEERQMLTTLNGGDTIDYLNPEGETVRIRLVGNITAEFIFVRNVGFGRKVVRDYVPSQFPNIYAVGEGADLYSIYIATADADSQIIITGVPNPTLQGAAPDRTALPYTGGGTIRVNVEGESTLLPYAGGDVYIGNRNPPPPPNSPADVGFEPFTVLPYRAAFGVKPAQRALYAGIHTAPGVSIGRILVGGTVTGSVAINGSIDRFYAANILTGDTAGTIIESQAVSPNNFYVAGDLRNLLVSGSVGTLDANTAYTTGAGIRVDGKLGNVHVNQATDLEGTFRASLTVINSPNAIDPLAGPYTEVEHKLLTGETIGTAFLTGELATSFDNDEADEGQYSASLTPLDTQIPESLQISGTVQRGESIDNYNLPLIAGQTITVDLDASFVGGVYVGIYDPQGRLVATDVPELNGSGTNEAFRFTAKQPGDYRLQVTSIIPLTGTYDFAGTATPGDIPYLLNVQGAGNLALGGVRANAIIMDQASAGLLVRSGDLGALTAVSALGSIMGGSFSTFNVLRGNLRVMDGGSIGSTAPATFYSSPQLFVPYGSVGLVRTTSGVLNINPYATTNFEDPDPSVAVGFDYQVVQSAGDLQASLIANRAIGTIRAASILGAPFFAANADQIGQDGRIDLIDVTGEFGTLATGGPGLFTGFGGNVKYVRVGGSVYADPFFGGGLISPELYAINQSVRFTDDSGAVAQLTPTIDTVPATGGGDGEAEEPLDAQLTLTSYGVRGSSGKVLIAVDSSTSLSVNVSGNRGSFDIGQLTTATVGTEVGFDETTGAGGFVEGTIPVPGTGTVTGGNGEEPQGLFLVPAEPNVLTFNGRLPVNVLEINATNLTNLTNNTSGDIVEVNSESIGYVTAQRVGLIDVNTPSELILPTNLVGSFPLDAFSYGINAVNIISIASREGVGNVVASGQLGTLTANADGRDSRDRFEGINGVVSVGDAARINIGEGVSFGGTGELPASGLFASGQFNLIAGSGADIRGTVVATDQIDRIALNNGSINGARIQAGGDLAQSSFLVQAFGYTDTPQEEVEEPTEPTVGPPVVAPIHYNIGRIEVTGGGILGSWIGGGDFSTIRVANGYGIFASTISFVAVNNPNGSVIADGLGIRGSLIRAGNSLNLVSATGDGRRQNVLKYPPSVRQSEKRRVDYATGRPLAATSDLHLYLGTSATRANISGVTNSGIIEDTQILGSGNLQTVNAFHVRSTTNEIPITSISYPMRIAFANNLGRVDVTSSIDGLAVNAGTISRISAGGNMGHMNIQASSLVKEIVSGRNIRGTFTMNVSGPNGSLGRLYAKQGYYGQTKVLQDIGIVEVATYGGRIEGSQDAHGLAVYGDMVTSGDPNTPTYFRVNKKIEKLFVGGDIQDGVTVEAQEIIKQTVVGTVFGDIIIRG